MIEVKVHGIRHGRAYAGSNLAKGSFVKVDGTFSAADIVALPAGQKNKPGYASAGDTKLTQVTSAANGQRGLVYPVNKLLFKPEGADTDNDTILAGQSCLYFQGGQYESDQMDFTSVSGTDGEPGDNLAVGAAGKLVFTSDADTSTQVVAKVVKLTTGDDYDAGAFRYANKFEKNRLWFELL